MGVSDADIMLKFAVAVCVFFFYFSFFKSTNFIYLRLLIKSGFSAALAMAN